MAVKKNANTTAQTETAKDAAAVEVAGSAPEHAVTGEQEGSAAPDAVSAQEHEGSPPEDVQGGKEFARELTDEEAAEIGLYMADKLRDTAARPAAFVDFVRAVVAIALVDAGASIREGGKERPATIEDILAVTVKGQSVIVVTRDGRKHTIKADANNEAD